MIYADYSYYVDTFKGQMAEDEYNRFSLRASAWVDFLTNNRTSALWLNLGDNERAAVQNAACAVADELQSQSAGGIVTSESNDGISRSFAVGSVVKSEAQRVRDAAALYLSATGLMFAGV